MNKNDTPVRLTGNESRSPYGASEMPDFSKRRILKTAITLGVVSSSAVLTGCSTLKKGLIGSAEPEQAQRVIVREKVALSNKQRSVFQKLASVLLPIHESQFPGLRDINYFENIEGILSQLSAPDRDNVFLGLSWFNLSPMFSWRLSSFSNMSDAGAQKHIANWQDGFEYQQGVVNTLYALALNAYWRDDSASRSIGYAPTTQQELPNLPIF